MSRRHDDADGAVPPVVVAVDGSPTGRAVLACAMAFADTVCAPVVAIHVRMRPTMIECLGMGSIYVDSDRLPDWRDELELDAWLDCVSVLGPTPVNWRFVAAQGDVVRTIKQFSEQVGATAVFLGTRAQGHSSLHRCPARALARVSGSTVHLVEHP
ncbi:MAG TPA: universal stress protein [Pseudonocardia sp.]